MGAAITLLVILTFSVLVVRTAAVALRLTGMPVDVARFQARSAFTGAGFTTSESEAVVNHPIRRPPHVSVDRLAAAANDNASSAGPTALLQVTSAYSVAEHLVIAGNGFDGAILSAVCSGDRRLVILCIEHDYGSYSSAPELATRLVTGDRVVLYGSDEEHSALHEEISTTGGCSHGRVSSD